jgi:hypothetical protein
MDATTQLASDVHLLLWVPRFILRCLLALIFLLPAPVLYSAVPFALIALDPNSDFCMLAFAYLALGPFASAFWTMMVGVFPAVYQAHKEGRTYEAAWGDHAKAVGFMLIGFFGSATTELLFCRMFRVPTYTSDLSVNAANWNWWFAGAGIAVFLPVILLMAWRLLKRACAGRQTCKCCRESVGGANLDELGLCSYCRADALNEHETDEEQEAWIREVKEEFGDKQWAAELRNGRRAALRWKRRILSSR